MADEGGDVVANVKKAARPRKTKGKKKDPFLLSQITPPSAPPGGPSLPADDAEGQKANPQRRTRPVTGLFDVAPPKQPPPTILVKRGTNIANLSSVAPPSGPPPTMLASTGPGPNDAGSGSSPSSASKIETKDLRVNSIPSQADGVSFSPMSGGSFPSSKSVRINSPGSPLARSTSDDNKFSQHTRSLSLSPTIKYRTLKGKRYLQTQPMAIDRAWCKASNLPLSTFGHTVCEFEDKAYIFGGCGEDRTPSNSLWVYDFDQRRVSKLSENADMPIPSPRCYHAACVYERCMYFFGGTNSGNEPLNDMWEYNFDSGQWAPMNTSGTGPEGLAGHSLVVFEHHIFCVGGVNKNGDCCQEMYSFSIETGEWTEVDALGQPPQISHHSALVYNDSLFIFGGYCPDHGEAEAETFYQFNFHAKKWVGVSIEEGSIEVGRRIGHSAELYQSTMILYGGKINLPGFSETKSGMELLHLHSPSGSWESASTILCFDFRNNKWSEIEARETSNPIAGRHSQASLIQKDSLFIFGGAGVDGMVLSDIQQFKMGEESASTKGIPRSSWEAIALKKHADVLQLREQLRPFSNDVSFARFRNTRHGRARTESDRIMGSGTMLQLIHEHLCKEGMNKTEKVLADESHLTFRKQPKHTHRLGRLQSLLLMSIKDPKRVFDDAKLEEEDQLAPDPFDIQEVVRYEPHYSGDSDDIAAQGESLTDIYDEPEENIVITMEGTASGRQRAVIEAGTFNNLVMRLTVERDYDMMFQRIFLTTLPSFATPELLLQKLIQRYHVPRSSFGNLTEEECQAKRLAIQQRVCAVLKNWIERHADSTTDKFINQVSQFIDSTLQKDAHQSLAKQLRNVIAIRQKAKQHPDDEMQNNIYREPPPEAKVSVSIFAGNLNLIDIDEEEIARQITIVEFQDFSAILPQELLNIAWARPELKFRAKNLSAMMRRGHQITSWVVSSLLTIEGAKKRAKLVDKFLKIAEHLRQLSNFASLSCFVRGLTHPAIIKTRCIVSEDISNKSNSLLVECERLYKVTEGTSEYQRLLKKTPPPCIPYMDNVMDDLMTLEESYPDMIGPLLNFHKRKCVHEIIQEVQTFQQTCYNLHPVYQIESLIREVPVLSGAKILSLQKQKMMRGDD